MSNFATYPNVNAGASYGENLANAARGFFAALFAVKPPVAEKKADEIVTPRSRLANMRKLYAMAAEHESLSPNLAAELRAFANRD